MHHRDVNYTSLRAKCSGTISRALPVRPVTEGCISQYLELLHLLLLLGLPLTDDAEHLAHHRLDPLRERLREGLPEEESVEDGLAPVVTCATPPARGHSETPARVGLPYCSAPHVDSEGTWLGLGA